MKAIADKVLKESNGRIVIDVFPASQLGDYTVTYEEIMRGTIELNLGPIPTTYDPRLNVLFIPYVVPDYATAKKAMSPGGYLYNIVDGVTNGQGAKLLGIYGTGFGGMATNKVPPSPADPNVSKGMKIRVAPFETFKLFAERMGYMSVTIPYADLFSALQTKVADGWIGGTSFHTWAAFTDILHCWIQYNDHFETSGFVCNLNLWNSLSSEDQKIVSDAVSEQANISFKTSEEDENLYMNKLADKGFTVIRLSDAELAKCVAAIQKDVWPKLETLVGKQIMDQIRDALGLK